MWVHTGLHGGFFVFGPQFIDRAFPVTGDFADYSYGAEYAPGYLDKAFKGET